MHYQANAPLAAYLLFDVLKAEKQLSELPAFSEFDKDTLLQVLEESAKFATEKIAPLNATGDQQSAKFERGQVTMPEGFAAAYQDFWQAGWPALSVAQEDGGQGLPEVFNQILYEWLSAANHGWTMAPGLLHGAYECIKHHASDALKAQYLEKVGSGQWLATMCLTEAHAGSDLGQVRTTARPQADGSYLLSGTKIFISGGEHDLTENIVHLVLARLPDAPPGPKGLSLFLVPKFYANGSRSKVICERIEEKMGIHASPTCVLRFEEASGELVGELGKGLRAMFVMMNAARLHVALQGTGLLDAALQKAQAYAQERRQMKSPLRDPKTAQNSPFYSPFLESNQSKTLVEPAGTATDLIVTHPAIQRILSTQNAWLEGLRIVAYQTALELDIAKHHPNEERRQAASRWCAFTTPVLKAACTAQGFAGISECLQVFGGHGYVSEWGIEQHLRDARIAMIYEGTNEIQAIDLLVRKTLADQGAQFNAWLAQLCAQAPALQSQCDELTALVSKLTEAQSHSPDLAYWIASDFLQSTALLLVHWAEQRLAASAHAPRLAYAHWIAPQWNLHMQLMHNALKTSETVPASK